MPTGTILAYSIPDGAQVLVDGGVVPTMFGFARTPTIIHEVAAGTHSITFRIPGYIDERLFTEVPQGGYTTITAIMRPVTK